MMMILKKTMLPVKSSSCVPLPTSSNIINHHQPNRLPVNAGQLSRFNYTITRSLFFFYTLFTMHALTNSGAVLLGVLFFFLLIFLAELSYIFCRRTGSFPDPPSPLSKELILQFLMCCKTKNQSRIEPSTGVVSLQMEEGVVAAAPEEEAVDKWRVSRLLFTIEEEDFEMEYDDDDDVVSVEEKDGELRVDIPVECSGEPTPFLTPCDSPPYFTPSPSPGRDIEDVIDVYDVSIRGCCFNFQGSQMCSNFG